MVLYRLLWKLVMGNSAGLGRHARALDEETESEGSEELLGEVKKDEHSR